MDTADWVGELGPLDPILAILANVLPLSRPVGFQVLKIEGPKGELVPGPKGLRWGMEPARSLDSRADDRDASELSVKPGEGVLNGLCEGVGREDCDERVVGTFNMLFPMGAAGNREGTVPALARLVEGRASEAGNCAKSGNPSVGDSGMFSLRGVELPLVGGPPHGFSGKPGTPS